MKESVASSLPVRLPTAVTAGPRAGAGHHACAVVCLAVLIACVGCAGDRWVTVRSVPQTRLGERLNVASWGGPKPSERTMTVLRRYNLAATVEQNPDVVLTELHDWVQRDTDPDIVYAFAELAFLTGKQLERKTPTAALDYYCAAVTHASLYLFDSRYALTRNPYDPLYRAACDLYNGSLECALRIWQEDGGMRTEHSVRTARQYWDIEVVTRSGQWTVDDFEEFKFVSDYDVTGISQRYETYGLGVPLIGVRKSPPDADPTDKFYPPVIATPVTAFLRLLPEGPPTPGEPLPRRKVLLELYDPLAGCDIVVNGLRVPLESDLTTPLAYFLQQSSLESFAKLGFFTPDRWENQTGLYLTEPYDPHKVPVVFVHGLLSSPSTWSEMLNDLRGTPEIRNNYQFWFYLYPTGQPFWISAAQMRADLREMRAVFDPRRNTATLDQMVLVGHSMGGLVSKLQTVEGGEPYWAAISETPFQLVKASDGMKQKLEETFFFNPNPSVRRVVTIASPHQGSNYANGATQWLSSKLISLPKSMVSGYREFINENPDVLRPDMARRASTSIDALSPDNPLLPVLYSAPKPPWVTYHNIVGDGSGDGDGIVSLTSARVENAESEKVIHTDHTTIHRHPETILEVRRVLIEHLQQVKREQQPRRPIRRDLRVHTTSGNAAVLGPPPLP